MVTAPQGRIRVIGSAISTCDARRALELTEYRLNGREGGYVCFSNVHAVVMGRQDIGFRSITNHSFLSVADGKPVYWIGRLKGSRTIGHIPGPDFFLSTLDKFQTRRHFFYGSTPQVLDKLAASLKQRMPALNICGTFSPPFGAVSAQEKSRHYELIRASKADFVWVGLGAPKQERWMAEAWRHLAPSILFGVGAAFDFYAGTLRRAPPALGWLGLEWLYRLLHEPRRLWRRYLVTNGLFLVFLLKDLVSKLRIRSSMTTKIGIFHPTDPLGNVPGGIDSVIRGIVKWAPADLRYTIFGATSDTRSRPIGREYEIPALKGSARFIPITAVNARARRDLIPLTVRYLSALRAYVRNGRCRDFDVLDFHRIEPLFLFKRDARPKNVVMHQDMSVLREKNCDILWRHAPWLYERMERNLFSDVDHLFAVRQTAVERYRRIYSNLASSTTFLPTWVDNTVFFAPRTAEERADSRAQLRAKLGIADEATRILVTVGRLDRQKDPLLMLESILEVLRSGSNVHLALVGDGSLRSAVEQFRVANGLASHVTLLGVQPPPEIAKILHGADLFVLTSVYEGMPIAVLEALSAGLPVVSTDVGEVRLVVRNEVNGCISADRTGASIAAAMGVVLSRIEAMRGRPCEAAIAPYVPEKILDLIYDNHRVQSVAPAKSSRAGSR